MYTLHHGDCLEILSSMPDGCATFAFTDPPYNVGKKYGAYQDAMPADDYFVWCATWLAELKRTAMGNVALYPPKIHLLKFWNMLPEHHQIICAWSPEGAIRGNFVHQYIPLLVPNKPLQRTKDHWWNVQVPGLGYFYREESFGNPGQTSLDITTRIIQAFTRPGDTVIDCFAGVGTTGVACAKLGRNFIGIELDAGYFQIAQQRIAEAAAQPRLIVDEVPQLAAVQAELI
jgi:DNA modification methylase